MKALYKLLSAVLLATLGAAAYASVDKDGVMGAEASISPRGDQVVFSADFGGEFRIWVSDLTGTRLRGLSSALSSDPVAHMEPAWSPDGQSIVYVAQTPGTSDIWVMGSAGGQATQLTANSGQNIDPVWSPDGSKIAFISDRAGSNEVWVMNPDGSGQTRLTTSGGQKNNPAYSPSGDQIVFSETANGATVLRIVNRDGSGVHSLTTGTLRDSQPHWGPAGIVFSSNRDGSGRFKIWAVQPDGSGLHKIGDATGHGPHWMDSTRIVFTDEPAASRAAAAVTMLDARTGAKTVLVDVQGYFTPIDIRPRKTPNLVNPRSRGKLEVAILSTPKFDATKAVNQRTLTFGRTGAEASLSGCSKPFRDVNGDGIPDLVCRFHTAAAGFTPTSTIGVLRFLDQDDHRYEGRDAITIVPTEDPADLQ